MKEETAVENLREIKNVLDKIDIEYWLDTGTLLGAVRNGKVIEWDYDIDLGTWYDNAKQIVSTFPEFREKGFRVVLERKGVAITATRSGSRTDIYLYRKTGDHALGIWILRTRLGRVLSPYADILGGTHVRPEGTFIRKSERLSSLFPSTLRQVLAHMMHLIFHRCTYTIISLVIPKHYFEKLSTINFYGMEFTIPSDVEKYLEYRYGSTWRIPTRQWTYYKDDGAII